MRARVAYDRYGWMLWLVAAAGALGAGYDLIRVGSGDVAAGYTPATLVIGLIAAFGGLYFLGRAVWDIAMMRRRRTTGA